MLYSPLATVLSRLHGCDAVEILACQTCATGINCTCLMIIRVIKGRTGRQNKRAQEGCDAVAVWTVWGRTYFSVRVRWNPNKAKSNSIHWLWQRVEPTKSFQNYFADCIVSQSRGWEQLLVLLTVAGAARSTSLLRPRRHYNINNPATGQRRVLVSHNSAGYVVAVISK